MISYDIDYMWSSNKCYKWTYRSWVTEVTTIMLDQAVKAVITFCICLNTHTFSYLRTCLLRPLSSAKNLPRSECYRILSLILKISTIYQQQRRLSWCSVNSPLLCFKKKNFHTQFLEQYVLFQSEIVLKELIHIWNKTEYTRASLGGHFNV